MDDISKETKKPITKRMIIVIILLLIIFGGIFGFGLFRSIMTKRFFATFEPPPVTISTTKATAQTWEPIIPAVGSLVAINGVQVTSELPGKVVKINFQSGQLVKEGDSLVQLDDREEQQDLKNFNAQLKLSQINYWRQSTLFKTGSTAHSALDQARATLAEAESNVGKTLVIIDKKNIKAPFTGKVGIRQVNLGQFIAAGTALVSLQALDPLYVQFSLPEQYFTSLYVGQTITLTVAAQGDKVFTGKVTALNSEVNPDTRNILVQGTLPNPQYLLYPGMFANVRVNLPKQANVVTVPQTAVNASLYGNIVYVVKTEGKDKAGKPIIKAYMKYVTIGERRDNAVAILKGIRTGDEVVTSGQLKLHDGARVNINNSVNLNQPGFNNRS